MSVRFHSARAVLRALSATLALTALACSESSAPTAFQATRFDVVPATPQTKTFASGVPNTGGRDANTLVTSFTDPYASAQLPGVTFPYAAYVITPNGAYSPIAGASWIGPYPQSGSLQNTTHDAQYTLERQIVVPENSTPTTLSVRLLADNAVTVYLDGVQFGQQPQVDVGSNFNGPAFTYVTPITPGTHTLSFWLRNGVSSTQGGPVGLNYIATLTYTCNEGFTPSNGACVDATPPEVVPTVVGTTTIAGSDWYTSDVTVSFAVSDDQSTVTSTGCETQTVTTDTPGITFTCSATSQGGTTERTVTIKRDATGPAVGYSGAQPSYTLDQTISIICSASDATSGIATNGCADIVGPAYTFLPGLNTFTATATDVAGNSSTATVSFTVQVTCGGLETLITRFVTDEKWAKKLGVHMRNVCDKAAKNSPAKDEQVKNFVRVLRSAEAAGAISAPDAALLEGLVRSF